MADKGRVPIIFGQGAIMYRRLVPLLLLTSCTTLDALSGADPVDYRRLYISGIQDDDLKDGDLTGVVGFTYQAHGQWASDVTYDYISHDVSVASVGLRYCSPQENALQPYLGAGFYQVMINEFEDGDGLYTRIGLDWVLTDQLRLNMDYRNFQSNEIDDSLVSVGIGWSF